MDKNDCKIAWMNTLSNRVFKTYEEAFKDTKLDIMFKSNRIEPLSEYVCEYVKVVFLWL